LKNPTFGLSMIRSGINPRNALLSTYLRVRSRRTLYALGIVAAYSTT